LVAAEVVELIYLGSRRSLVFSRQVFAAPRQSPHVNGFTE
jgi:hypothetical protein